MVEIGAGVGTAFGTLALAVATFVLAVRTKSMAQSGQQTAQAAQKELELLREQTEAARQQSETAQAALRASIRPILVDVPENTLREIKWHGGAAAVTSGGSPHEGTRKVDISMVSVSIEEDHPEIGPHIILAAPVRNVGAGVAMIRDVRWLIGRSGAGVHIVVGTARQKTVPVGEHAELRFEVPYGAADYQPSYEAIEREKDLLVEVIYADLGAQQVSRTQLSLRRQGGPGHPYRVYHANVFLVDYAPVGTPWG